MIGGNVCTRACRFCDVKSGHPLPINPKEPEHVAASAKELGLEYVVVTAVNRDDLEDGGAGHFAEVAHALRQAMPGIKMEFLIPDFMGDMQALQKILDLKIEVVNHNLETVRSLTPQVRNKAKYERSLELLDRAKRHGQSRVKTGIMLGLGESREELRELFADVASIGLDILTLGQYLRPTAKHLEVERFVPVEEFEDLRNEALAMGIPVVYSGPYVRSSYHAGEVAQSFAV